MSGLASTFDDKQWMLEELTLTALWEHGEQDENNVNLSLLRWNLRRTPLERLEFMERRRETLQYLFGTA